MAVLPHNRLASVCYSLEKLRPMEAARAQARGGARGRLPRARLLADEAREDHTAECGGRANTSPSPTTAGQQAPISIGGDESFDAGRAKRAKDAIEESTGAITFGQRWEEEKSIEIPLEGRIR
ncbi:hypothetical protein BHM03_00037595 [Ensete ventricosum]|nr:hypothetical protein BHM03_00037595 [Ensete ventricosum]